MLVLHSLGSTVNPDIGSGTKWTEGESLMQWTRSHFKTGKTDERVIRGKRIVFKDMFSLGFQLSIVPKRSNVDPDEVLTQMMKSL